MNTLLFFSVFYIVLYLIGWAIMLIAYSKLKDFQKNYTEVQVSDVGVLVFVLSICYNLAYWFM